MSPDPLNSIGGGSVDLQVNFDEALRWLGDMASETKGDIFVRTTMLALANHLLNKIFKLAPKKTGRYASSWTLRWNGKYSLQVYTPMKELFMLLEYTGAYAHDVYPKTKKALHWTDELGEHFAAHTYPKGFEAKPHFRPAVKLWEQDKLTIIYASAATVYKIRDPTARSYVSRFAGFGQVVGDHVEIKSEGYRKPAIA